MITETSILDACDEAWRENIKKNYQYPGLDQHRRRALDRLLEQARRELPHDRIAYLPNGVDCAKFAKANGEAFAKQLESMSEAQLAEVVTFPGGGKTRFDQMLGVKEHEMHHRAQLMLIERLLGIVPHLTPQRLARAAQAPPAGPAGA